MIVTSKRCYLNILTQICDKETLLNANYYMGDIRTPDGNACLGDNLAYDEHGRLVINNNIQSSIPQSLGRYNISYGSGQLDPTPYVTNTLVGIGETYADPYDRFIAHLNSTDTMIETYNFLFSHELRGNGLQILIFSDDSIIEDFGHIICEFLSQNFGQDITFIDPIYRPVKGKATYVGDKAFGIKHIERIRDMQLLIQFNGAVSQSGYDETFSNLTVWLNNFSFHQIIHLYNLLFPNDPLPPDNYTTDHIKQIIIGRVAQQMPKSNPMPNIFCSDEYLKLLSAYEEEEESTEFDFDDYV